MIHYLNLHDNPFQFIKKQLKTIEMRLNDEKRKQIKIGDILIFTNIVTKETLSCEVINLYSYSSFEELYKNFNKEQLGYLKEDIADSKDMEIYYSKERIIQYGVLGIEIKLINK